MFDQLFFIVDSNQQNMLLGLPALTAANLHLLTVDSEHLMLSASKVFGLDVGSDKVAMPNKMTIARLLNQIVIEYRTQAVYQDAALFNPYVALKFSDLDRPEVTLPF